MSTNFGAAVALRLINAKSPCSKGADQYRGTPEEGTHEGCGIPSIDLHQLLCAVLQKGEQEGGGAYFLIPNTVRGASEVCYVVSCLGFISL